MAGFEYPGDYPLDCPPEPCEPLPGIYYRLIEGPGGCTRDDFLSSKDKGIFPADPECYRRSVSIYKTLSDARRAKKVFPKLPRHVAELNLPGVHGAVRSTPQPGFESHHDWWIPKDVQPVTYCVRVVE
jgi:hypothetical protein